MKNFKKILVIGGGGYVGSCLVPLLLENNYFVTVFDLFIYGKDKIQEHKNLSTNTSFFIYENLVIYYVA